MMAQYCDIYVDDHIWLMIFGQKLSILPMIFMVQSLVKKTGETKIVIHMVLQYTTWLLFQSDFVLIPT